MRGGETESMNLALCALEACSGAALWWTVLRGSVSAPQIAHYALLPYGLADDLVYSWPGGAWAALQVAKALLCAATGRLTEAALRHAHLPMVFLYAARHGGGISTVLLASLVAFHVVDATIDFVLCLNSGRRWPSAKSPTHPEGEGQSILVPVRCLLLGFWLNRMVTKIMWN